MKSCIQYLVLFSLIFHALCIYPTAFAGPCKNALTLINTKIHDDSNLFPLKKLLIALDSDVILQKYQSAIEEIITPLNSLLEKEMDGFNENNPFPLEDFYKLSSSILEKNPQFIDTILNIVLDFYSSYGSRAAYNMGGRDPITGVLDHLAELEDRDTIKKSIQKIFTGDTLITELNTQSSWKNKLQTHFIKLTQNLKQESNLIFPTVFLTYIFAICARLSLNFFSNTNYNLLVFPDFFHNAIYSGLIYGTFVYSIPLFISSFPNTEGTLRKYALAMSIAVFIFFIISMSFFQKYINEMDPFIENSHKK